MDDTMKPESDLSSSLMPLGDVVQFRTMAWWHAALLMIAEIISLGILSLPSAFAALGVICSIVLLLIFGGIAYYTGIVIGQFKLAHPHVTSFAEAGELLLGPLGCPASGRNFFAVLQCVFMTFIAAAHLLTFSIMMNVLTDHGTCTIAFVVAGWLISMLLTVPRTLKNVSYFSIFSCISIFSAVVVTMAYVGSAAKGQHGAGFTLGIPEGVSKYRQIVAISNMTLAYSGNVAFFGFFSELRRPKDFAKAVAMLQGLATTVYVVTGIVIYYYVGTNVPSPALGAASPLVRKIAYGLAIPTILIAGVINAHVACRYIFNRWCSFDEAIMGSKSQMVRFRWYAVVVGVWTIAWLLAEAIPLFNALLGLIASLLGSWFTYGASGYLWFYMSRGRYTESASKVALASINILCILLAVGLLIVGTYASIHELAQGAKGLSFSCANNAPISTV